MTTASSTTSILAALLWYCLARESGKQDVQTTGDSANYQPSLFCGNTKHIDHVMVTINMACISFLKFVHLLDKFRWFFGVRLMWWATEIQ